MEGIGEVQPAEALQVSLEATVASLPAEPVATEDVPLTKAEEVRDLPGPIPGSVEGVSDLPLPTPRPAEDAGWKVTTTDEFGAVEIPLPGTGDGRIHRGRLRGWMLNCLYRQSR